MTTTIIENFYLTKLSNDIYECIQTKKWSEEAINGMKVMLGLVAQDLIDKKINIINLTCIPSKEIY